MALRAERAEPECKVETDPLLLHVVEEGAFEARLAKPTFVIRANLLLFADADAAILRLGMSVDALGLTMASACLLLVATDGHLLLNVNVEVVAVIAAGAPVLDPVDADELLALALIDIVI